MHLSTETGSDVSSCLRLRLGIGESYTRSVKGNVTEPQRSAEQQQQSRSMDFYGIHREPFTEGFLKACDVRTVFFLEWHALFVHCCFQMYNLICISGDISENLCTLSHTTHTHTYTHTAVSPIQALLSRQPVKLHGNCVG